MSKNDTPQHKRMAMGERVGFKNGGSVPVKTGIPQDPLEKARRNNGVPGMMHGGKVGGKCNCG